MLNPSMISDFFQIGEIQCKLSPGKWLDMLWWAPTLTPFSLTYQVGLMVEFWPHLWSEAQIQVEGGNILIFVNSDANCQLAINFKFQLGKTSICFRLRLSSLWSIVFHCGHTKNIHLKKNKLLPVTLDKIRPICFTMFQGRTCSMFHQTKLFHQYLLTLKLMGYHWLNGPDCSDGSSKSPFIWDQKVYFWNIPSDTDIYWCNKINPLLLIALCLQFCVAHFWMSEMGHTC